MDNVIVSIIIVNYNTWELLSPCINSIAKYCSDVRHEVIIVDNASSDGSVEKIREQFPYVKLISNNANMGFGKANNQALGLAEGEYVFLLNSDTLILDSGLSNALSFMKKNDVAMLTPKLVGSNGSVQRNFEERCTIFTHINSMLRLTFRVSRLLRQKQGHLTEPALVDFIIGAAMLIKRSVVNDHGLFDEQFFFTGEEADLCLRYRSAGLSIYYYPEWSVMHLVSAGDQHKCFHMLQYLKSLPMLVRKHAGWAWYVFTKQLTMVYICSSFISFRIKSIKGGRYEAVCAKRYAALLRWYFGLINEQDVYDLDCCKYKVKVD